MKWCNTAFPRCRYLVRYCVVHISIYFYMLLVESHIFGCFCMLMTLNYVASVCCCQLTSYRCTCWPVLTTLPAGCRQVGYSSSLPRQWSCGARQRGNRVSCLLHHSSDHVKPSALVCDLGIYLHSEVSMYSHVDELSHTLLWYYEAVAQYLSFAVPLGLQVSCCFIGADKARLRYTSRSASRHSSYIICRLLWMQRFSLCSAVVGIAMLCCCFTVCIGFMHRSEYHSALPCLHTDESIYLSCLLGWHLQLVTNFPGWRDSAAFIIDFSTCYIIDNSTCLSAVGDPLTCLCAVGDTPLCRQWPRISRRSSKSVEQSTAGSDVVTNLA